MTVPGVWSAVCDWERLQPGRGVAAWLGGRAIAVFRTTDDLLFAMSNLDPFSQASVLSRGLIGDHEGQPVLASPMHKQRFDLATGICLDDPGITVPCFAVRVRDGVVEVEHATTCPEESTEGTVGPLAGFTVGVTAARRAAELGSLLQRRGAQVVHGPAIRIVPLADDTELLAATRDLVAAPPDITVVTTGIGFRGWIEAADGWGQADGLLAAVSQGEVLTRGPKARGAVRAAGLTDAWSPGSESNAEVLTHLLARNLTGVRVALQLHGEPLPDFVSTVRAAGAHVVEVPVYRWVQPEDLGPLDRLVAATLDGGLDAICFTSAPAAASLLRRGRELGVAEGLLGRLRHDVLCACVGPVTAAPLVARGVPVVIPERARIGALVRTVTAELPARATRCMVAGHRLELRGQAALINGVLRPIQPAQMALLGQLSAEPGRVVTRGALLAAMPGSGTDEHAVETAVARLRTALAVPGIVQTVVKRGYRLAVDDDPGSAVQDSAQRSSVSKVLQASMDPCSKPIMNQR